MNDSQAQERVLRRRLTALSVVLVGLLGLTALNLFANGRSLMLTGVLVVLTAGLTMLASGGGPRVLAILLMATALGALIGAIGTYTEVDGVARWLAVPFALVACVPVCVAARIWPTRPMK